MNTKQIEMIIEGSKTLNFTKAAENLYVSQPTLTYQIQMAEEELGFKIFDRTQKSVSITPAGKAFIASMIKISSEYKTAVEEAQNYSDKYSDDIVISLPYRSAIHLLPKAIMEIEKKQPVTLITPRFGWRNRMNDFLQGNVDIIFEDFSLLKDVKGIEMVHFYKSHIYLVCNKSDELANKTLVTAKDLKGRTLMVGGGSQHQLKIVQKRVIEETHIPFFNSDDHDTTLTNIAANRAIVLAPGFLHDRNDGFAWVPFDCEETIDCCLAWKKQDNRESMKTFIKILMDLYKGVDEKTL